MAVFKQTSKMSIASRFRISLWRRLEMLQSSNLMQGLGGTVDRTHSEMVVALVSSHIVRRVHPGKLHYGMKINVLGLVGKLAN